MNIIKNETILPFDIDQTLIMYTKLDRLGGNTVAIRYGGSTIHVRPNKKHIDLLRHHKERGYYIIAWSANGFEWANRVIEALELSDCVDLIMTKPKEYVDDKDVNDWMPIRIYIEED
jgi:predicted phosphatase